MRNRIILLLLALLAWGFAPAHGQQTPADAQQAPANEPLAPTDGRWVISGRGTAHGFGLAMDGVLGMAKAGWPHQKILDTFYTKTQTTTASGTIRVGLAKANPHRITLPGGGNVQVGTNNIAIPAGGVVVVGHGPNGYTVETPGLVKAAQLPVPTPKSEPEPTPTPTPSDDPASGEGPAAQSPKQSVPGPIVITPDGSPAISHVAATSRRYKGTIEILQKPSGLWAINEVDLDTYVMGIAEEKGQNWPINALETLAVAARSLGVATKTWYDKNQANGFDICNTSQCQVYLGLDGEEAAMRTAVANTKGKILTHGGRAILGTYHGNGGGMTETWSAYPYLKAVSYPFAKPKLWEASYSDAELITKLRAGGIALTGQKITGIEVLETGDSPRVVKVKLVSDSSDVTVSGSKVESALDLPSRWFEPSRTSTALLSSPAKTLEAPRDLVIQQSKIASHNTSGLNDAPMRFLAVSLFAVAVLALIAQSGIPLRRRKRTAP